jgi:hypothetical protein
MLQWSEEKDIITWNMEWVNNWVLYDEYCCQQELEKACKSLQQLKIKSENEEILFLSSLCLYIIIF